MNTIARALREQAPQAFDIDEPTIAATIARIAEGALQRDREREHPFEAIDLIRKARLGAVGIPLAHGGKGARISDVIAFIVRLAEADTNVAHVLRNHFTFVERFLRVHTRQSTAKWLAAALDGAIFGLAHTELERTTIGGGGPFHTKLTPVAGGYRLNGTKFYSTGTLYADYVLTRGDLPDGTQAALVVPTAREGVERIDDWDGIGQRVTGSGTTHFHDVFVATDEVIHDDATTAPTIAYTSTIAQLIVTAVVAGAAKAALNDARALLKGRTRAFYYANTTRAEDDPILQQTLGEIASNAFVAEAAVLAAARQIDRAQAVRDIGQPFSDLAQEASLAAAKAKVVVDDLTLTTTTALFDVGGASAAARDKNLDRHWRNARTLASHNPRTLKAQWIGRHELTGEPLPDKGFF